VVLCCIVMLCYVLYGVAWCGMLLCCVVLSGVVRCGDGVSKSDS
jgi:hypothetical protein